jgi:hypothetical protein
MLAVSHPAKKGDRNRGTINKLFVTSDAHQYSMENPQLF